MTNSLEYTMIMPETPPDEFSESFNDLLVTSILPQREHDLLVPDSMIASWIKQKIEDEFEHIIYEEIDSIGQLYQETWKIVAYNIIKKLKASTDMAEFLRSIQYVRTNIRSTRPVEQNEPCHTLQIEQLVLDMNTQNPMSTRIHAFNVLLKSQLLFTITSHESCIKHWLQIRKYFNESLSEDYEEIFYLSLKAHAKLINSPHPGHIQEGFQSLLGGFNCFYNKTDYKPLINLNSIEESKHRKLVRIMHLLLYTINNMPRIYLRSNDNLIEDIFSRFFELLTVHHGDKTILSPYTIVSALDPQACWFSHILHGVYAQNHVFSVLSNNLLVRKIVDHLGHPEEIRDPSNRVSFIHSTRMFTTIVKYSQGRRLFPLATEIEDGPITLEHIYLQVVNYLNYNTTFDVLEDMVIDGLPYLIKAGVLKSDSPLMRAIFYPFPTKVPPHITRALETIVSTREGVRCLLGAHDTKTLFDVTAMALRDHVVCTADVKTVLLRTCGKLLEGHRGFSRYKDTQLIPKAATCFLQQLYPPSESGDVINEELFRFLSSVGSTPLGILTLSRFSTLMPQLQAMWSEEGSEASERCLLLANMLEKDDEIVLHIAASITDIAHRTIPKDRNNYGNSELYKFLKGSKGSLHDSNWHIHLRRAFKASSPQQAKTYVVLELLDHVTRDFSSPTPRARLNTSVPVDDVTMQIARWIIGYGESNHLLQAGQPRHLENLLELFSSYRRIDSDGFSFFLGIAFLICGGHIDKSYSFLAKVATLPAATFFWPHKSSVHFHSFGFKYGHFLELLIEEELPVVARALKMSGLLCWQICRHWLAQCFITVLGWDQICQWLIYCFISLPEQCVYYCVALLRHMQADLLQAVNSGNVDQQWHTKHINRFQVTDHLHFMDRLAKRHHGSLKI